MRQVDTHNENKGQINGNLRYKSRPTTSSKMKTSQLSEENKPRNSRSNKDMGQSRIQKQMEMDKNKKVQVSKVKKKHA